MLSKQKMTRGDTLIEVLLAFTIFTSVAVATFFIMNRGVAISQRSLEITLVREQIDAQTELVRFIHDTKPSLWDDMKNLAVANIGDRCGGQNDANSFFVNVNSNTLSILNTNVSTNYNTPETYSQIRYGNNSMAYGMWVQITEAEGTAGNQNAYDVHVFACWQSVGPGPESTIGTVVRLYDNA